MPLDKVSKKIKLGMTGTRYAKFYKDKIIYAHDEKRIKTEIQMQKLVEEFNAVVSMGKNTVKKKLKDKNVVVIPIGSIREVKKMSKGRGIKLVVEEGDSSREYKFEAGRGSRLYSSWSKMIANIQNALESGYHFQN